MLRMKTPPTDDPQSGQAAVEAALTLPLTIFLILGTLQFFLLLQARTLTEYAAFRAVRTGSVKHGDCQAMTHAAIAALLPTFARTDTPEALGRAFGRHNDNQHHGSGHTGPIVWLTRERPLRQDIRNDEEESFDDPARYTSVRDVMRLESRLIFWFPMRIPFANWVLNRMFLARWGLRNYTAHNPLLLTETAHWNERSGARFDAAIAQELVSRSRRREYVFPLQASYSMRMMTPARRTLFRTQNCEPTPEGL
ncbi:TadE/TadG family type IV pilus assembly protein [Archangium primigenium]|uniref:TadE/TadG family type IV pilus assembly protein n=1 Tax=[Archangium] primigenium TaxID=2792470 RepID=UPI001959F38D|nr:TadE family protein [Archangium primigenium]MBM7117883.1 pilus assembly protein [Archangium primigenium]